MLDVSLVSSKGSTLSRVMYKTCSESAPSDNAVLSVVVSFDRISTQFASQSTSSHVLQAAQSVEAFCVQFPLRMTEAKRSFLSLCSLGIRKLSSWLIPLVRKCLQPWTNHPQRTQNAMHPSLPKCDDFNALQLSSYSKAQCLNRVQFVSVEHHYNKFIVITRFSSHAKCYVLLCAISSGDIERKNSQISPYE